MFYLIRIVHRKQGKPFKESFLFHSTSTSPCDIGDELAFCVAAKGIDARLILSHDVEPLDIDPNQRLEPVLLGLPANA